MRLSIVITFAAAVLFASPAAAQSPATLDSAEVMRWHEDLAFLKAEMPKRHANLFHEKSQAQFDSAFRSIDSRLPSLSRHQVIVELQRVAAMIGDGHSNVGPWRDSVIAFHSLPIALYWFEDGLIVRAADSARANLIGARVVEIGDMPIDSAIALVRPLVSHDNEMGIRAFMPFFLAMPEILHATGITRDMNKIRLVTEQGGKRRTTMLGAAGLFPMLTGDADKSWNARRGWVDARDHASTPLWLSDPLDLYWYRYLVADKTMLIQINTIQQKSDDSLGVFIRRAIDAADSAGADRLVLDLRLNGGGNGGFNKQIFLPLIKSKYDVKGKLFVLTGRRTWSAAQMLVTEMQKYTNAIFVGEPTASKGNAFGDSYRIVLPNSKVTFRVSTLWHQYLDSRDKRDMIAPQIPAPMSFADYSKGRDPALEAAIKAR
ncbi:MAG: S41 family peptidase [Gemmatimonadales bacterium]